MSRRTRHKKVSDASDYTMGYLDGQRAAFEESELDAYYAGVGYGKKKAGDKHIGFNNAEERLQFEKGITQKERHFISVQNEEDGECVYETPHISEIQSYCKSEIETLWDEVKRFENPHKYYVDLSEKLWNIKMTLLKNGGKKNN